MLKIKSVCPKCEKKFDSPKALRCHLNFNKICSTDVHVEVKKIQEGENKVFARIKKGPYDLFKSQWEGLFREREVATANLARIDKEIQDLRESVARLLMNTDIPASIPVGPEFIKVDKEKAIATDY